MEMQPDLSVITSVRYAIVGDRNFWSNVQIGLELVLYAGQK